MATSQESLVDGKRRRVARSCDNCRRKSSLLDGWANLIEIKCSYEWPVCSRCSQSKLKCTYHDVEKRRAPLGSASDAQYVRCLENRLRELESILQATQGKKNAYESKEPNMDRQMQYSNGDTTSEMRISAHPIAVGSDSVQNNMDEMRDLFDQMLVNEAGDARFIGRSAGISIFSVLGRSLVDSQTKDNSFGRFIGRYMEQHLSHKGEWSSFFEPYGDTEMETPLPTLDKCSLYIDEYFNHQNPQYMVLDRQIFDRMWNASDREILSFRRDESSYALSNLVLAMGKWGIERFRRDTTEVSDLFHEGLLRNVLRVLPGIMFSGTNLASVQIMLLLCRHLSRSAKFYPIYILHSVAARMAQSIGLHRKSANLNFSPLERRNRQRVWWYAYIQDKDIALRTGRPSAINDVDFDIDFPTMNPSLACSEAALDWAELILSSWVQLAKISSEVQSHLYSPGLCLSNNNSVCGQVLEFDQQLQAWQKSLPIGSRPGDKLDAIDIELRLALVELNLSYYSILMCVHRRGTQVLKSEGNIGKSSMESSASNARTDSDALNMQACRNYLRLAMTINAADSLIIASFAGTALTALFIHILREPSLPESQEDLYLLRAVSVFFDSKANWPKSFKENKYISFSREFTRVATLVMGRTGNSNQNPSNNEDGHFRNSFPNNSTSHFENAELCGNDVAYWFDAWNKSDFSWLSDDFLTPDMINSTYDIAREWDPNFVTSNNEEAQTSSAFTN